MTSCFVYKVFMDLSLIDHLCIILSGSELKWRVQVNVPLNNCKQNITSLSHLVGTTVHVCMLLVTFLVYLHTLHG